MDVRVGLYRWAPKNWCFWTVVLEKTLEGPLDYKQIQPVHPKGDQSWVFIGRTDVAAETPILWPPDVKSWLIWKAPDAGKDWRQEETGTTEDEMVGWHHWLCAHESEYVPGVGDRQGSLACCSPWGHKEWDMTEQLNWIGWSQEKKLKGIDFQLLRVDWVDEKDTPFWPSFWVLDPKEMNQKKVIETPHSPVSSILKNAEKHHK